MKHKNWLLITLIFSSVVTYGQSSVLDNTNSWISIENIDLYSQQTLPDTFFITINKTVLTLKNGDIKKDFQIENVHGSWPEINAVGQLAFDIPLREFKGKGIIQNEAGVISLTIDFSERKDWMKRKFIIKK